MSGRAEFVTQLTDVARALQSQSSAEDVADVAVKAALELVPGCDSVVISLLHVDGVDDHTASDDAGCAAVALQHDVGEGPIQTSIVDGRPVHSPDLSTDHRWPTWAPIAVGDHGFRSALCYHLSSTRSCLGAMSLFSSAVGAFDEEAQLDGLALSNHVAFAVATQKTEGELHLALARRSQIGQAIGLLMERFDLAPDTAFDVLCRLSSEQNTKLHKVASDLVASRELPVDSHAGADR